MIERLAASHGPGASAPAREVAPRKAEASSSPGGPTAIPDSPPPEVLEALDTAAAVLEELAANRVSLRFLVDEESSRVEVEVRDGEGQLIRTIPPTRLLEALSGPGADGLVVDTRG